MIFFKVWNNLDLERLKFQVHIEFISSQSSSLNLSFPIWFFEIQVLINRGTGHQSKGMRAKQTWNWVWKPKFNLYPTFLSGILQLFCYFLQFSARGCLQRWHCLLDTAVHRRRKYGRCSPNSLRPISYFVSIWELYVFDLKTKVFCRKENQLHFPMDKGLTVPK